MSSEATKPSAHSALIVGGAAVLGFAPLMFQFGQRLWNSEHYSFFPLFLAAIVFLAVRTWREMGPFAPRFAASDVVRWVLPACLLAAAVWLRRPWLAGVSGVIAVRAFLYMLGGREYFREVSVLWFALWLCIPLPFNLDKSLVVEMQHFASKQASLILDWLGYRHLLTGVLLNFPDRIFEVEEACSGIQSLYASLAAVAIYCAARKRGVTRLILLLLAGAFWVLVLNIARILAVVIAEIQYGIPLADEVPHQVTGYVIFGLALLAIVSTEHLLLFCLPERDSFASAKRRNSFLLSRKLDSIKLPRLTYAGVAGVFVILLIASLVRPGADRKPLRVTGVRLPLAETTLPAEIAGWTRKAFEVIEREPGDINGEVSYIWTFERAGLESKIAVDGPFGTWHDLGYCYRAAGWTLTKADDLMLPDIPEKIKGSRILMERPSGRLKSSESGHVVYAVFEASGNAVEPPPVRVGATGGARLQGSIAGFFVPRDTVTSESVYCVQALCTVPLSLSEDEQNSHTTLLSLAAASLCSNLSETASPTGAKNSGDSE